MNVGVARDARCSFRACGGIRTHDLLITNELLCRTELHRREVEVYPSSEQLGLGPRDAGKQSGE